MPVSFQTFLIYYVLWCNFLEESEDRWHWHSNSPGQFEPIKRRCSISTFLPVGLKNNSAVIFPNAVQQVCLKICYAINMQHKVFIALFVPSVSLCEAAPSMPSLLLTYCFLLMYACAPAHTNTPIFTTTRRGGSLELATITVCIVAYSLCLTGHTTSALLLSPVHCLLHQRPCKDTHTHTNTLLVGWGGSVHSCRASRKPSQGVNLPFAPLNSQC